METAPPRLVYDDDCGFCTWVAEYADDHGEFELVGFSDLTPDQRARLPANFEECAHLLTHERVYSCGAAMEEVTRATRRPLPTRHRPLSIPSRIDPRPNPRTGVPMERRPQGVVG